MVDRDDPDLAAIVKAAEEGLRASVNDDAAAAEAARRALVAAAGRALAAGRPLREIAAAEQRGQSAARDALRAHSLKLVERSARRVRDAQTEHERAVVQATKLGLSTRDVAAAAGVTHGTIRAISLRATENASDQISDKGGAANQDLDNKDTHQVPDETPNPK
jgi:DNA-binding NarL/FixJ family response regulator